jgi:hypothetical protein
MNEAYHGYYIDLGAYISEPIPDIHSSNLHKFDFVVHRVTEGLPKPGERIAGALYNITHVFTILNPDLSRKNFENKNWKLSAQFRTPSQFTPRSVFIAGIDVNGVKQEFSVNGATHEAVIDILKKLDEMGKYYDWSHYNLVRENEDLRKEIAALKEQVEDLGGEPEILF